MLKIIIYWNIIYLKWIFCNIINIFTVTFKQFNASWGNKNTVLFKILFTIYYTIYLKKYLAWSIWMVDKKKNNTWGWKDGKQFLNKRETFKCLCILLHSSHLTCESVISISVLLSCACCILLEGKRQTVKSTKRWRRRVLEKRVITEAVQKMNRRLNPDRLTRSLLHTVIHQLQFCHYVLPNLLPQCIC